MTNTFPFMKLVFCLVRSTEYLSGYCVVVVAMNKLMGWTPTENFYIKQVGCVLSIWVIDLCFYTQLLKLHNSLQEGFTEFLYHYPSFFRMYHIFHIFWCFLGGVEEKNERRWIMRSYCSNNDTVLLSITHI